MLPLLAEIRSDAPAADQREAARRTLRLEVALDRAGDANALIHNLSETGLLIGTGAEVSVGDRLVVELPHAGPTGATVVWSRGGFAGCEFDSPLSRAAVSAALLKSPADLPAPVATAPPPRLWSDIDDSWLEAEQAEASRPVLLASMALALLVAGVLAIALLRFPFAD